MTVYEAATWAATGFLSVAFLFGSSIKIFGWHRKIFAFQLDMVSRYGLNRWHYLLIGIVELFGAVAILWNGQHWVALAGALAILATSTGAMFCHAVFDRGRYIVPSVITFSLSLFVAVANLPR